MPTTTQEERQLDDFVSRLQPQLNDKFQNGDAREILEHGKRVFIEQKEAEKEERLKMILKLEPKCMSAEAGGDAYEAAETCLSLVDLYRQGGVSTRNDWYRISTWLQRACDLGFLDGCVHLAGLLSSTNKAVPIKKNEKKALEMMKKGLRKARYDCENNNKSGACRSLGSFYLGMNREEGKRYLSKACELKEGEACHDLAVSSFNQGLKGSIFKDEEDKFLDHLSRACDFKYGPACNILSAFYANKGDEEKTVEFCKSACDLGVCQDGEGNDLNLWLASLYFRESQDVEGLVDIEKKDDLAVHYTSKSCDCNSPQGCFQMGYIWDKGKFGLLPDIKKAKSFYDRACGLGNALGCEFSFFIEKRGCTPMKMPKKSPMNGG